ncbi:MAG: EamA family transporter, partial [Acidimicrobiia bacterium]|nr:EamA family transporter [Acidimicrobiia bacterium]
LIVAVMGETGSVAAVSGTDLQGVVALAFVPGLVALLLYYNGLRSTPASAATLAELAFPLTATGLNYVVFGTVLTGTQWIGVTLLAGTITVMSWLSRTGGREALGVRTVRFAEA